MHTHTSTHDHISMGPSQADLGAHLSPQRGLTKMVQEKLWFLESHKWRMEEAQVTLPILKLNIS